MLRLRYFVNRWLGRCCSVGQRTCLRRTLTAPPLVVRPEEDDGAGIGAEAFAGLDVRGRAVVVQTIREWKTCMLRAPVA